MTVPLPYTGKQYGATVTFNSIGIPGWQKIVIKEDGKPLPDQQDITHATSTGFTYQTNPLGSKGSPKTTVTVAFLIKRTDYKDGAGILAFVLDSSYALIVRKGTGAGKDMFTETMTYKSLTDDHAYVGKWVSGEMTFEANSAIAWAASLS